MLLIWIKKLFYFSWEVMCRWAPHPVLSITSGFSKTTTAVGRHSCHTHENCMHAEQIIIFYICFFFFFALYFVLFSIALYRTIVTVYTNNIFLYNYLWEMHQIIIHLSPVGCFTPAGVNRCEKIARKVGLRFWFSAISTRYTIVWNKIKIKCIY